MDEWTEAAVKKGSIQVAWNSSRLFEGKKLLNGAGASGLTDEQKAQDLAVESDTHSHAFLRAIHLCLLHHHSIMGLLKAHQAH
ncbi:hypothetical protein CFP56_021025 [Quercus suber]|uniref:Uncharacterized protein n=1 Tax=Quercus suber TaxID=58331 RepID=A0AAW0KFK8_QUESU